MQLHTGHHHVLSLFGLDFNMDTILLTWLVGGIIIAITVAATSKKELVPSGIQNVVETILEMLVGQLQPSLGKHWAKLSSLLFTFFLFIFISNEIGLIPSGHLLASPTNDLNTTVGLALATSMSVWVIGLKVKGIGYLKHFFQPISVFVVINLMEELSKPLTLSFRLFGNIMAGEIMLEILYALTPYLVPIVWIIFSLVIGLIQAFVFTILTTSYLSLALQEEH